MPRRTDKADRRDDQPQSGDASLATTIDAIEEGEEEADVVPEGMLVCALTGEHRAATPQEETLQSFIEQLHREYGIPLEDMARDVRLACVSFDETKGKERKRTRTISLVAYEAGAPHESQNIVRVAIIAKSGTKADAKSLGVLEDVLGNLSSERARVYGLWSNGSVLEFRMRTYQKRTGDPIYTVLADFPAPDETLEDLEIADRRPLRIATGDSLLRTFKRCHDYLYGNQSMRGDRAFWQLLYLIFCKILDEHQSRRLFFVGATEANTEDGQKKVATRIRALFKQVQEDAYSDVFDGTERIELNNRALAYVAGELSRYNLLSTDTDAKGLAYEAITSTTLKKERGQFFTPRNVIQMMVEMVDPQPGKRVFDPACGSGGFLVVALAHQRRRMLAEMGVSVESVLPSELKKIEVPLRKYAKDSLFGADVDPELRKTSRMNMVMNNDGHGNIFHLNSIEYGVPERASEETEEFKNAGGGHKSFDYVFTNPPFGSKIPVTDPAVLSAYDLGHAWARDGVKWIRTRPHAKVPPEVLFIEACYNFLKPGTGVLAIVLPNGILGNPGEQMEAVRWWMLRHMELLASIDLPAETFLPQVSVQASCVFLRRRDEDELRFVDHDDAKQGPVFMAIPEYCGHGRRGEARYVREPDGRERISLVEVLERWEKGGVIKEKKRLRHSRELADDLPWVARQFRAYVRGEAFEAS